MYKRLTDFQVNKINTLSAGFSRKLVLNHPTLLLQLNADSDLHKQAFTISLHSPLLQEKLGRIGYNVDAQLDVTDGFYEFQVIPTSSKKKVIGYERVDVGFGHAELKKGLEATIGALIINKYYYNGTPIYDIPDLEWPATLIRKSKQLNLEDVFGWTRSDQILQAYESYALTCRPAILPGHVSR
jgi:hypothetical protein